MTQVVFGVVHVPPHVGAGEPPEHVSRQKQFPLMLTQLSFGWLQVPPHAGKPLPPSQDGGMHKAGRFGRGPTHVHPGGQVPPQASVGGSA